MKNYSKNFKKRDEIFTFQNLLKCYYQCRKRKRYTIDAAKFELSFEKELLKLEKELKNHTYYPSQSICFVITEPKPREVFAANFKDRVVHHLLVNYLEPIWEPKFIDQSYSCRREKGVHKAIKDLKRYIRKVSRNFQEKAYFLQLDVQSFFPSLKKEILFNLIKRHTKNPDILWLSKIIIFQDPTQNYHKKGQLNLFKTIPPHKSLFKVPKDQGLPIGNLTSQFFANVYLNELDQFVKHQLKVKFYLRYVDDLVLLHQDKEQLKKWRGQIDKFLQERLKLRIHPQKQNLQSIDKGVNFLGYIVKPDYSLVRRRVVKNLKRKLWNFNWQEHLPQKEEIRQMMATVNSYYGQFRHANSFGLRQKLWRKNFGKLKKYLIPVDINLSYFHLKKKDTLLKSILPEHKIDFLKAERI